MNAEVSMTQNPFSNDFYFNRKQSLQLRKSFLTGRQASSTKVQIYGALCMGFYASLVAQMVKNLPAMQKTRV